MLGKLRNFSKTKLASVLVGIIIIPFVFWGMGGIFQGGNTNNVAKIGNHSVSTQNFLDHINSIGLNPELIKNNLDENIMSELLNDMLAKKFIETPYLWGGKTSHGIDCSGLVQVFYKFNNIYCPRDTGPQFRYFKKFKSIKKDAIIFWKGHVAICLSKRKLIHAYGPKKKVVIMDIKKTINLIEKTAKLKVIGIK